MPAAVRQASRVSFTQDGTGTVRMVPPLANEIDDRPTLLASLQAIKCKFGKFAEAQTTSD